MARKDLTAFLREPLELPWKDRVFVAPPPSKEDGFILTALNVAGVGGAMATQQECPTCHRTGDFEVPEQFRTAIEAAQDRDLADLTLGPAYREMLDAGVPGADIDMFALYAHYFWVMGEEAADQMFDIAYGSGGPGADSGPKGQSPSPSGNSTVSANQSGKTSTASASTRTTGSRKTSSPARKPASKKAKGAGSGGSKS